MIVGVGPDLLLENEESVQYLLESLEVGITYGLDYQVNQESPVIGLGGQLDNDAFAVATVDIKVI